MTDEELKHFEELSKKRSEMIINRIENHSKLAIQANVAVPCDYEMGNKTNINL
jgi:hypothetical protein